MIYQGTILRVIDNSGARYALCIKVLHKNPKCRARLGDKIIVVIKKAIPGKKVKTHNIHKAIVVRDPSFFSRTDGSLLKWIGGACILINNIGQPLGKRILGPVSKELRKMGHLKIISISSQAI